MTERIEHSDRPYTLVDGRSVVLRTVVAALGEPVWSRRSIGCEVFEADTGVTLARNSAREPGGDSIVLRRQPGDVWRLEVGIGEFDGDALITIHNEEGGA